MSCLIFSKLILFFLIHSNPENFIVDAVDEIQKADKPKIDLLISEFIRLELEN